MDRANREYLHVYTQEDRRRERRLPPRARSRLSGRLTVA